MNGPVHLVGLNNVLDVHFTENSLKLQIGHLRLELTLVSRPLGAKGHHSVEALDFGFLLADVVDAILLVSFLPRVLNLSVLIKLSDVN